MRRSKFRRPCKVLIFNGARVLVAIVRSLHCAAELTHENKSAIHNCCTGKSVRSGVYYYRQLHPDILLEIDDLDKVTLKEYDDLCGVKRKYISTRKMAHIRCVPSGNTTSPLSRASCFATCLISGEWSPITRLSGRVFTTRKCPSRYRTSVRNCSQTNGCRRLSIIVLWDS